MLRKQWMENERLLFPLGDASTGVGATGVGYVVAAPFAKLPNVDWICGALCRITASTVCTRDTAQRLRALFTGFDRTQPAPAL